MFSFSLTGRNITVDWGDRQDFYPELLMQDSVNAPESIVRHYYPGYVKGSVIVTGDSICDFSCMTHGHAIDIDFSHCLSLENLKLGCTIEGIDLSKNINLKHLTCIECNFQPAVKLDLSNNSELTSLLLIYTFMDSINLSNNHKLDTLKFVSTRMKKLDLSNNNMLSYVWFVGNRLKPQEMKTFLYSLHNNQIKGEKRLILEECYSSNFDKKGIIYNDKEEVSFDINVLKERGWW